MGKRWWLALSHEAINKQKGLYDEKGPKTITADVEQKRTRHELRPLKSQFQPELPIIDENTPELNLENLKDQTRYLELLINDFKEDGNIRISKIPDFYYGKFLRKFLFVARYAKMAANRLYTCGDKGYDKIYVKDIIQGISFHEDELHVLFKLESETMIIDHLKVLTVERMIDLNIMIEKATDTEVYFSMAFMVDNITAGNIGYELESFMAKFYKELAREKILSKSKMKINFVKNNPRVLELIYFANYLYSPFEDSDLYFGKMGKLGITSYRDLHRTSSKLDRSDNEAMTSMNTFNKLMGKKK